MADAKEFKHIRIPSNRFSTRKVVRKRGFPPSVKYTQDELAYFSETLTYGLKSSLASQQKQEVRLSSTLFKLTTRAELRSWVKEHIEKKLGLKWLNPIGPNSVIVALPLGKEEKMLEKIREYGKTGRYRSYFNAVSKIEPIRIGDRVSEGFLSIPEDNEFFADVEFFSGLNLEDYSSSLEYINSILPKDRIKGRKTDDPEMPFVRVIGSPKELNVIATNVPSVRKIEPVPAFGSVSSPVLQPTPKVTFEPAQDDLETVMIIDCGVDNEHPGIRNVLITKKSYLPSTDTKDVKEGHGTKVAGLASYGPFTKSGPLRPSSKIGVAKVHDGEDINTLIETTLENIVKDGVSKSIRIYSLTVLYEEVAREISKLAYEIDELSRRYNVLFLVSSGNLLLEELERYRRVGLKYPDYLRMQDGVYQGAEATCALTIGGVAQGENNSSIAKRLQISPFSRAGLTPDGRLKPDLVHYAGNLTQSFESNEELGIVSLNSGGGENLFSSSAGTSFSTPIVANLASQVLRAYPTATANLIRALLVHHADIEEQMRNIDEPHSVYGFGFPNIRKSILSNSFSPTLIFEGTVELDKVAEIRIPVPKELGRLKGSRLMKITLAYDPPVSRSNQAITYPLVDLNFAIHRKNNRGKYSRASGKDSSWQTPQYRCDSNNSIKKDTFQWERGHTGEDWIIRITPSIKLRPCPDSKQKFALVVTIEHLRKEADLYTAIENTFEQDKVAASTQLRLMPQSIKVKRKAR